MEGAFGTDAMAGVAAGMVGNMITRGMSQGTMTDARNLALNKYNFKVNDIAKASELTGSLASSMVTYAMTDRVTFNVARIAGAGVLEMNVGKGGFSMNLGTGGTDISFGTMYSAARGFKEGSKVVQWKRGSNEQRASLNSLNSLGWTGILGNMKNVNLAQAIWDEDLKVRYEDLAENNYGYFHRNVNPDEIVIAKSLLGQDSEAAAKIAAALSHEESHWAGNPIEALAQEQGFTTYSQINALFNLKGDTDFYKTMIDGYMNPDSWRENDAGERQDWKVIKNSEGKVTAVIDDKDYDTIYYFNESGESLGEEQRERGFAKQISQSTGGKQSAKDIEKVLYASGLDYLDGQPNWSIVDDSKQKDLLDMYFNTPASAQKRFYTSMITSLIRDTRNNAPVEAQRNSNLTEISYIVDSSKQYDITQAMSINNPMDQFYMAIKLNGKEISGFCLSDSLLVAALRHGGSVNIDKMNTFWKDLKNNMNGSGKNFQTSEGWVNYPDALLKYYAKVTGANGKPTLHKEMSYDAFLQSDYTSAVLRFSRGIGDDHWEYYEKSGYQYDPAYGRFLKPYKFYETVRPISWEK